MSGTRAAIRYAKAIFESAHSQGLATDVEKDMSLIATTISGNAELKAFLLNPVIKADAKENALQEIFSDANSLTKNLFKLLSDNKRFEILGAIASEFNTLFDVMNGIEVAKVTTAVPMDSEMEGKVLSKILTFSNKKVVIENIVDPSIIGGFILRIGDQQYNASISNRLKVLKRALAN